MDNSEAVTNQVREGAVDLGLVEGQIDDPSIAVVPIAEDELVLVAPVTHSWAKRPPRSAEELKPGPWVLRERGAGRRSVFEAALRGLGLASSDLHVVIELPSNEAVRAAVEAGSGVAVMSKLVAAPSIAMGSVTRVDFPLPHRRFFAVRHKERHVTRAEEAFLDTVSIDPARKSQNKKSR
jgi:DNA-binding transcriptional LysR family regulator